MWSLLASIVATLTPLFIGLLKAWQDQQQMRQATEQVGADKVIIQQEVQADATIAKATEARDAVAVADSNGGLSNNELNDPDCRDAK